jgi:hypothetical protein
MRVRWLRHSPRGQLLMCPYPEAGCDGNGSTRLCETCPRRPGRDAIMRLFALWFVMPELSRPWDLLLLLQIHDADLSSSLSSAFASS